jgi:RHS repeat-associated protein
VLNLEANLEERGYTGHEHLLEAGLIHMNGRLYFDPLGRMLQADPLVQNPYDGQNYNRYSYVLNNPLALTDPTGYSWWTKWRRPIVAVVASIVTYGAASGWFLGGVASDMTNAAAALSMPEAYSAAYVSGMSIGGTGVTYGTVAGAIGGAAAGFAAGGIMGGNIESAVYGAFSGAITGGVAAAVAGGNPVLQVGAKAGTSAALAYVQGGDGRRAGRFAALSALGGVGWGYTRDETDRLYAASCAREGNCVYDSLGAATDGGRSFTAGFTETEWNSIPQPFRYFIAPDTGMAGEGSGDHLYDPGHFLCNVAGDTICGAVRGFVRQVSKPHDWGNSWSYDKDPASLTYGMRIVGGGYESLGARVAYEVGIQSASLVTMLPMAGYTAFSLYGDYLNPAIYGRSRP